MIAIAFVVLCFLPYAAVPLGQNSNLPISSLLAVLALWAFRPTALAATWFSFFASWPLFAAYAAVLVAVQHTTSEYKGTITWIAYAVPCLAIFGILKHGGAAVLRIGLLIGVISSCLYALLQYLFLLKGTIPLVWMYGLPGYSSIDGLENEIAFNEVRPFGWFPEPSFLCATIVLGSLLLVALDAQLSQRITPPTWASLLLVAITIILARSGVAVVGLPLLAYPVFRYAGPRPRFAIGMLLAPVAVAVYGLIGDRTGKGDYSWGDRIGTLVSIVRYAASTPQTAIFGVGRAQASYLLDTHQVTLSPLITGAYPTGVYSALGTWAIEGGLVFGALPCVGLIVAMYLSVARSLGATVAASLTLCWVLVGTLALGYDSAALLAVTAGGLLGLSSAGQVEQVAVRPSWGSSGVRASARP